MLEDVFWEGSWPRGRRARLGITFSGSLPEVALAQQGPKPFIANLVAFPEVKQRASLRRQAGSVCQVVACSGTLPRLCNECPSSRLLPLGVASTL